MCWNYYNNGLPDCVPEYYREKFEREAHKEELRMERREHYKANQKKMEEAYDAGLPILDHGGYDACWQCKDADYDTQTFSEDDFARVICHNPACPEHNKHKEE